ncbi:MAG: MBL fold metallo-hydrolase [Alicyclobacillus sp.]|nr:MBL fold metallo-hydrolase [Alicyclobacillus sp.]
MSEVSVVEQFNTKRYTIFMITSSAPFPIGTVNMYLVRTPDSLVLVDAGIPHDQAWNSLLQGVRACGAQVSDITAIVLTHHHLDHIGLIEKLVRSHSVRIYAHPYIFDWLISRSSFVEEQVKFFTDLYLKAGCGQFGRHAAERLRSRFQERHYLYDAQFSWIHDGDAIPELIGMEVLHTPGHAPDHIALYDPESRLLIGGDLVLPRVSTNALVERAVDGRRIKSVVLYHQSLQRCAELSVNFLFPGHGPVVTWYDPLVQHRLRRIDEKAETIYELLQRRSMTPMAIAQELYPQQIQNEVEFPLVMSEVIGMLDYLEHQGKVAFREHGDIGAWVCEALAR